jgi:AraC-like DNA-binding protein
VARIRRHRRRAPKRVRPLLAYLEEHLFDPGLTVERWCRECGGPHAVRLRRGPALETACRLLADTGLLVREIAAMVGYGHVRVFGRAFVRWSGVRLAPSSWRGRPASAQSSPTSSSARPRS